MTVPSVPTMRSWDNRKADPEPFGYFRRAADVGGFPGGEQPEVEWLGDERRRVRIDPGNHGIYQLEVGPAPLDIPRLPTRRSPRELDEADPPQCTYRNRTAFGWKGKPRWRVFGC